MESEHYSILFNLMKEKIDRLELEKNQQRKEVNKLRREVKELKKQIEAGCKQ